MLRTIYGATRSHGALFHLIVLLAVLSSSPMARASNPTEIKLQRGWRVQSSTKVSADGPAISSPKFPTEGWYEATVPSTVLAVQVASGEFPDPNFGMNLRQLPGMTYPIGLNSFNRFPMSKDSPYAVPWWYRTEFQLPREYRGKVIWLHLQGINNRANLWLNGHKVADAKQIAGAYRIYEFNVTDLVEPGKSNVIAAEVFAPTPDDLALNWVDWNPTPPDKNMGLWGDVSLSASGPVSVRYPAVMTHFADDSLKQADLTVRAELQNATAQAVDGILQASFDNVHLEQNIQLQANERLSVQFAPEQYPQLRIKDPKIWWPAEMGTPSLHRVTVRFLVNGQPSDEQEARFGIREVTSALTPQNYRLFRINGKPILIRGGAWDHDMLLRPMTHERYKAHFEYVREMHLNTIRQEGQLETGEFYDLADEYGILIMAGWCCCDVWEQWDKWRPGTLAIATDSLRTEMLKMRSHPSMLTWLNGSDGPPPAGVERAYLEVEKQVGWPNPVVSSASDQSTALTGKSGVKMTGPYDYEPPSYWLEDKSKWGGGWGYNTETGPGPAIPPLESLKKMLPKAHLWPVDEFWNFHSAGERFKDLNRFNEAMNATYGPPSGLEDYLRKAQAIAYDGERAMFEAYGRNKYTSTGVIQWTLNNAWPSTYWHLYDYYMYPAGGYFGTRKACEPLHVQYSYDDRDVVVINTSQQPADGLTVSAQAFDFNLEKLFAREVKADAGPDSSTTALTLPDFSAQSPSTLYFVKLVITDAAGKEVSSNFYWLPAKSAVIDWDNTPDSAFTPVKSFEDLTALNKLPSVKLQLSATREKTGANDQVRVSLHNPSKSLAFQVHVGIRNSGSAEEILPVLWEDNYLTLLPGESRTLTARYLGKDALKKSAELVVDGWNVEASTIAIKD
ncbi:MAG: glycosyl hydrolase 2 galactose-binding domain-containing protein [Terriglobales bacterium]